MNNTVSIKNNTLLQLNVAIFHKETNSFSFQNGLEPDFGFIYQMQSQGTYTVLINVRSLTNNIEPHTLHLINNDLQISVWPQGITHLSVTIDQGVLTYQRVASPKSPESPCNKLIDDVINALSKMSANFLKELLAGLELLAAPRQLKDSGEYANEIVHNSLLKSTNNFYTQFKYIIDGTNTFPPNANPNGAKVPGTITATMSSIDLPAIVDFVLSFYDFKGIISGDQLNDLANDVTSWLKSLLGGTNQWHYKMFPKLVILSDPYKGQIGCFDSSLVFCHAFDEDTNTDIKIMTGVFCFYGMKPFRSQKSLL